MSGAGNQASVKPIGRAGDVGAFALSWELHTVGWEGRGAWRSRSSCSSRKRSRSQRAAAAVASLAPHRNRRDPREKELQDQRACHLAHEPRDALIRQLPEYFLAKGLLGFFSGKVSVALDILGAARSRRQPGACLSCDQSDTQSPPCRRRGGTRRRRRSRASAAAAIGRP